MSLELRAATITVGRRTLLEDVNLTLEAGEFIAVLGANGVGKTTLLRTLAGIHSLASGMLHFNGNPIAKMHADERARAIALVASDDAFIEDLRVSEVVATGRYPFHRWWQWNVTQTDDDAVTRALRSVDMEGYADRLFATLSSGERQRIWIALALAQEAPTLLLDEPTSHLDLRAVHDILTLLRGQARAGKSVVCALHDVNDALAYADRVVVLGEGRILACDLPERIVESCVLEIAYGIRLEHIRGVDGSYRILIRSTP